MIIFANVPIVHRVRGRLQSFFFPMQRSLYILTNGTQSFGSTVSQIQNLAKENSKLHDENEN